MTDDEIVRRLILRRATSVHDDVPTWAWSHGGRGRIAVGTVALAAGRPAAGKSTFGRHMSAQVTRGALPGCWEGTPTNVAYIAREEAVDYIVKPSLRAHGADLDRVFFPEVEVPHGDDRTRVVPVSIADMHALTEQCRALDIRFVVVDPMMGMIGSKTDVNRNNEVRAQLDPWRRLAEDLDGVVLGIAHLNKAGNGDVVAGINGSSAFGEIARAVFGFTKDPESETGERVLSQEKNSMGDESLALRYRIDATDVQTDSGRTAEVGRFVILGDSDRSVGDVLRDAGRESSSRVDYDEIITWLRNLVADGPVLAEDVYKSGDEAGFKKDQLKRAKAKAGDIEADRPVNPGPWYWQRAGSTERTEATTREEVRSAPCEVRGGLQGAGSREHLSTQEAIPAHAQPVADVPTCRTCGRRVSSPTITQCQNCTTPLGGVTADTPGMTPRVQALLARQDADR